MENKKLQKEELNQLKDLIGKISELTTQVGGLEAQKLSLLQSIFSFDASLKELQEELKEKYGEVSINIQTGEITDTDELSQKD